MNGWGILFFALVIVLLVLFIVLQRRKPERADEIAASADGVWKRWLAKLRGQA